MALSVYLLLSFLLTVPFTTAEYQIWQVGAYSSANYCAKSCAAAVYGSQAVFLCGGYPPPASCLCNSNGHSSTMNDQLSRCPSVGMCGGAAEGTQAMAVFSAYCYANLGGTTPTTSASTGRGSSPTLQASTGATASNPLVVAAPTQTSSGTSDNSNDSSSDSKSLSQSDKIAIGCAVGGAIVAVLIAVPGWIALRRRRRGDAPDSQPLHNVPQTGYVQYQNPAQQPFLHAQPYPQPYQQQGWGWRS